MIEAFRSSELERRVNKLPSGAARKPAVNINDCELKELIQYRCELAGKPEDPRAKVVCEPVLRLFRK